MQKVQDPADVDRKAAASFAADLKNVYESESKLLGESLKGSKAPENFRAVTAKFYDRLNDRFEDDCRVHKISIACKEGCSYCCYLRVEAFAHEVFLLARYIHANFSDRKLSQLKEKLKDRSARAEGSTADEYHRQLISCALLENDRCSVYTARPVGCRRCHSTDVDTCRFGHENPHITDAPAAQVFGLAKTAQAGIDAFRDVLKNEKLDSDKYELNQALLAALGDPELEEKWRQGKRVFEPLP